jgi:hypothetical protein
MNIGFYGHSSCAFLGEDSFLTMLSTRFTAQIVNAGARQGSEERILFCLKKSKNLDFAVIFHSEPGYVFLPNSDRDIDLTNITDDRIEYLMTQQEWDFNWTDTNFPKFKKEFETVDNFKTVARLFRKHFYNPDMMVNRFYGALMQIDKYLKDKNIPCIHILNKSNAIPNWFKFESGPVNYDIMELVKMHKTPPGSQFSPNVMTREGNNLVAENLAGAINAVHSR